MRDCTIASSSRLNHRLGELCIVGFEGLRPSDPGVARLREQVEAGRVGGAIFFRHNIESAEQVGSLVADMRSWACARRMWIMVDQEGGKVQRLHPDSGFAGWPSQRAMATESPKARREHFDGMAAEIAGLGFNANLSPVVDLHFDNSPAIGKLERSFGEEIATVVDCARVAVEAYRHHGLVCAIKHFPGHGSAAGDTHKGFTDVGTRHQDRELKPFSAMISSGHVDMVMTSHLVCRPLTGNDLPLTLSRRAVAGTIRETMGFGGVIISDDLYMGALRDLSGGMPEAIVGALSSGHDLLLVSGNRAARGGGRSAFAQEALDTIDGIRDCIIDGMASSRLDPVEIERSLDRVDELKRRTISRSPG